MGVPKKDSAGEKPPLVRADAIGRVAKSAKAAGVSQTAIGALQEEAKSLREQARLARPLGAQFDSAQAEVQRAETAVDEGKTSMEDARKRLEQAEEKLKQAKVDADTAEVRMREEREREPPVLKPNDRLLQSMRELLDALQQVPFPDGIPRDVHVALEAAKAAAGPVAAESPEKANGRSRSADDASLGSGDRDKRPWTDEEDANVIMDALDEEDEDNVHALADIAKRLKKARRL